MNFAVLGDEGVAAALGRRGTRTDITLYDRKESGIIRTWAVPNGFPERIQPLFQAIGLSEFAILHVGELDRFAGEQIVALDVLGMKAGILSRAGGVDGGALGAAVRGTVAEGYAAADGPDMIRAEAAKMAPAPPGGGAGTRVAVDHCFDVRGAGTVALGRVASGTVRRHDVLRLLPSGAEVSVRSIQMHDDPVDAASFPARVGLSLKGVRPDGVGRGDVLCGGEPAAVADEIELDFARVPYYRGPIAEGQMCVASVGLNAVAGRFLSADPVRIKLDRPIAYDEGDRGVVLRPESAGIRIAGGGRITGR